MTKTQERYVSALVALSGKASTNLFARELGISKQAASRALIRLAGLGLVHKRDGCYVLTNKPKAPPRPLWWRNLLCEDCQRDLVQDDAHEKPKMRNAHAVETLAYLYWHWETFGCAPNLSAIASQITQPRVWKVPKRRAKPLLTERIDGMQIRGNLKGLTRVSRQSAWRYVEILRKNGKIDGRMRPKGKISGSCLWCKREPDFM